MTISDIAILIVAFTGSLQGQSCYELDAPGPVGPSAINLTAVPCRPAFWRGNGAPAATLGNNGDSYLDQAAMVLYGPKSSGSWPAPGIALGGVGTPGPAGPAGPAGPTGAAGPPGAVVWPTLLISIATGGASLNVACNIATIPQFSTTVCPTAVAVSGAPSASSVWFGLSAEGVLHIGVSVAADIPLLSCVGAPCTIDGMYGGVAGEFPVASALLINTGGAPLWGQLVQFWSGTPLIPVLIGQVYSGMLASAPGLPAGVQLVAAAATCLASSVVAANPSFRTGF